MVLSRRLLATYFVAGILTAFTLAGVARPGTASAACTADNWAPLSEPAGNGTRYVWARVAVIGCTTQYITVYLAEKLSAGYWYNGNGRTYGPQGSGGWLATTGKILFDCNRYAGTGWVASAWRINNGPIHQGTAKAIKICR